MTRRLVRRLATITGAVASLWLLPVTPNARAAAQAQTGGRTVFASVLDTHGRGVTGLSAKDFVVEIDGAAASVLEVKPAADPPSVVILVDGVTRVESVNPVRSALRSILARLRAAHPDARVGLMAGPTEGAPAPSLVDITGGRDQLDKALDRVAPSSFAMPLLERAIVAADAVGREAASRRLVIVVTNDAAAGTTPPERVAQSVRDAGAQFWVLHLWPVPTRNVTDEETVLRELPVLSGGRRITARGVNVDLAATQLMDAILSQYAVTYAPASTTTAGTLRVGVRREGVTVAAPTSTRE
jgi:hypothetical protein